MLNVSDLVGLLSASALIFAMIVILYHKHVLTPFGALVVGGVLVAVTSVLALIL